MKSTLKTLLIAQLSVVLVASFFLIFNKAQADYTVITSCYNTPQNDSDYFDVPTILPNGNVTVTSLNASEQSVNVSVTLHNLSNCGGFDTATGSANTLKVPAGNTVGLNWLSDDQASWWNFTTGLPAIDSTNQPVTPFFLTLATLQSYTGGMRVNGAFPSDLRFNSESFIIYRNASVEWNEPNFRDNMITPDFTQWWFCINVTEAMDGYYWEVAYTDGVTSWNDSSYDTLGVLPTYNEQWYGCVLFDKETALSADDYTAIVYLYDQDDNLVAQSDLINITITSGTQLDGVPAGDPSDPTGSKYADCANFTNVIRQYGCYITVWALIPDQETLDNFSDLKDEIETVAPFSYFYQVKDAVSGFSADAGTVPTLTITNEALALESEIFSPDTLDQYISSGTMTFLRGLMQVVLYLAFFSFVIYEIRSIYKK